MTVLSVNVNKMALLRNSRGSDFPNLIKHCQQLLDLGVKGITVHPRPDERHITRQDVFDISEFLHDQPEIEFNIEGFPSSAFLDLVLEVNPAQCTLVPDLPGQLTSDHGWDIKAHRLELQKVLGRLRQAGIRSSLFLDPCVEMLAEVPSVEADRIELYTEDYASQFGTANEKITFERYMATALKAQELGIGVNAGHDLNLANLTKFLSIPGILEVSIGHALVVESLQQGLAPVISQYLSITNS